MSTEKNLENLVINKVESEAVYNYMKANNLINVDELYFIKDADGLATETDDGLMSSEDKIKLDSIQENAEQNVQSDWNVIDTSSDAYIKNKPTTLPANGGDADTVNNHTVESDVPENAVFTDTVYTHPNYEAKDNGLYKITVDDTGHVVESIAVTKDDITAFVSDPVAITTDQIDTICGATIYSGSEVSV